MMIPRAGPLQPDDDARDSIGRAPKAVFACSIAAASQTSCTDLTTIFLRRNISGMPAAASPMATFRDPQAGTSGNPARYLRGCNGGGKDACRSALGDSHDHRDRRRQLLSRSRSLSGA
jgi:hypothetical protein